MQKLFVDHRSNNATLSLLLALTFAPAGLVAAQSDGDDELADEQQQEGGSSSLQQPSEQEESAQQPTEATQQVLQQTQQTQQTATEEEEEEAEAEHPEAQLPWRNTYFSSTTGVSFNSFFRNSQLTYNPTVNTYLYITPRWYLSPQTFIASTFWAYYEFTNANGSALNHDFQVLDPNIEIRQLIPFEGFVFMPSARITLPLSKSSQALQRYFGTSLGLTITRPIEEINFTIAALFRYSRWWAGSNIPRAGGPLQQGCQAQPIFGQAPGDTPPIGRDSDCDGLGDVSGARDSLLAGVSLTWTPFAGLSIFGQYFLFAVYGYELGPAYAYVDTAAAPIRIDDGSATHWRNYSYFTLAAGYDVLPWFNLSVGVQNTSFFSGFFNANGTVRNPVFTPDTQVYLSTTFQLDAIYQEVVGAGESNLTPEQRQRRRQGLAGGPRRGGAF